MSELLIIRHAVAHERDPSQWPNDDERPLTDDGTRKFRAAARGLARIVDVPDELLSSPLPRARQTAAILEDKAKFPTATELDLLRPETAIPTMVRALKKRPSQRIALVGHEPELSLLVGSLLGGLSAQVAVQMKKGAVAQLSFAGRIDAGKGQLIALLPPRVLRRL